MEPMPRNPFDTSSAERHKAVRDSRREREFYRYYEALRSLSSENPTPCDLNDAAAAEAHNPRSSPDKALTAFCQLGALRLNARRAMTFFFDNDAAYVLAESTRTLSLEHDSVHDEGDQLWLGYSVIPRFCSVCEYTVDMSPSEFPERNDLINIVNDLREDARFCYRPFVISKPNARFYAGVPITTASGVNIGAYCILDDTPRNGLDSISTAFLHDMAATIMSHLETLRAKAERKRATQMVDGLGAFVRTTSSSETVDGWHLQDNLHEVSKKLTKVTPRSSIAVDCPTPLTSSATSRHKKRNAPKRSSTEPPLAPGSRMHSIEQRTSDMTPRKDEELRGSRLPNMTRDTRTMFQQASELIRSAIDMDAVVFLDTLVGRDGGLLQTTQQSMDPAGVAQHEMLNTEFPEPPPRRLSRQWSSLNTNLDSVRSSILGSSHAEECGLPESASNANWDKAPITEGLLLKLLNRYPRGKCWNFDKTGSALSTRELSDESSESLVEDMHHRKMSQSQETYDDGEDLHRLFPGIRSFALVGMWDQEHSRWFSACAIWSYEPLRILSDEYEVNFLSAFAEVVMAEVYRLRLQASTKSKSDFISSISHELRSPLHGILGSVECLQEHETNETFNELITQIDICGRTLLDIIDHLLDFSKINNYAPRSDQHAECSDGLQPITPMPGRLTSFGGTGSLDSDTALDVLTEEIIATTVYSYCCSKESNFILNRNVSIICNIDFSADLQWMCHLPTGSWKRLCMNLVNNALKFTSSGHISVSLRAIPSQDSLKAFDAELEVSDTGCGMSADFLKNHLFEAFVQEDGLIEGTGLGMSLVAKIVKAFGGKIDVQSESNVGTTVTIVVPVDRAQSNKGSDLDRYQRYSLPKASITVVNTKTDESHSETGETSSDKDRLRQSKKLLLTSIRATCADLGLDTATSDLGDTQPHDISIMTEADFLAWKESCIQADRSDASHILYKSNSVIVLCNSAISKRRLVGLPSQGLHVEFVAQPVGPDQLTKSIKACLKATQDRPATTEELGPIPETSEVGASYGDSVDIVDTVSDLVIRARGDVHPGASQQIHDPSESSHEEFLTKIQTSPHVEKPSTACGEELYPPGPGSIPTSYPNVDGAARQRRPTELCLLLVDDNEINLKLLVMYAKKQGHHMFTARTGLEAVESYKSTCYNPLEESVRVETNGLRKGSSERVQVVLMDINMPEMNGFEATRQIRRFERRMMIQPAFIVALTGLGNASAQAEAYNSGMNCFLTKPVSFKKLTETLKAVGCG